MSMRLLRGGNNPFTPSGEEFGPTNTKDWVIANAGHTVRTVTKPSGAVELDPPGGLTQAVLDAYSASTVFWLKPGTHTSIRAGWDYGLIPKSGQTIVAPNDGTCVIDGGGYSIGLGKAAGQTSGMTNITVRGGKWINYGGNDAWKSAIAFGPYWIIEDAWFTLNGGTGVRGGGWMASGATNPSHTTIRYCSMTENGRYGYGWMGMPGAGWVDGIVFEHNYVRHNNTGFYNPGDDAGGSKCLGTINDVYQYNYITDNYGFDAWWDTSCSDVLIQENVFIKNLPITYGPCLFHWEDCGSMKFYRNWVQFIGTQPASLEEAAIKLVASIYGADNPGTWGSTEVYQNRFDIGQDGIMVLWTQQFREVSEKNHFHDNDIWYRGTSTGRLGHVVSWWPDPPGETRDASLASLDNLWSNNHYHFPTALQNSAMWSWPTYSGGKSTNVNRTWAQWQALGHDLTGTREFF